MSAISTDPRSTYRIFISFTKADHALAEYLARGLRRILDNIESVYCFSLPGSFNSKGGSHIADNFLKKIDDSLKSSNVFILLWSVHAKSSGGVLYELNMAKHFLMNRARRQGREFKIIPIRIDKCGLPIGLHNIVHTDYTSGGDFHPVLNSTLDALSLPPEDDDLSVIVVKDAIFDVKTAFRNEDWAAVTRQYPNLMQLYPHARSSTTHFMYAIALIKQGQVTPAQQAVHQGLALGSQKRDSELLDSYVQCLKQKNLWNEILFVAEKAIANFPDDARWLQLRLDAIGRINRSSLPLYLQPQNQMTRQFNKATGSDASGQTYNPVDVQYPPVSYSQQFSSVSQNDAFPTRQYTYFPYGTLPLVDPVTEQLPLPSDDLGQITRKLSDEALAPESPPQGFGPKMKYLIRKHFSHEKLQRLLSLSLVVGAFFDILCLLLISLKWPFTTSFMDIEAIVTLLLLCAGRMAQTLEVKFSALLVLGFLWGACGYSVGSLSGDWLGWRTSAQLQNCVEIMGIIVVISIGLAAHFRILYHERKHSD